MIDNLANEYNELLKTSKLYYKFFRIKIIILMIAIFIFLCASIIICSIQFNLSWLYYLLGIALILPFIIYNHEINLIVKKEYKCNNTKEVIKSQKAKFITILSIKYNIDLSNEEQLNYLIELTELRCRELKPKAYIKGGIIAGTLGPLWLSYISTIFKLTTNIDAATRLFFIFLFFIFNLFLIAYSLKITLIDSFVNSTYYTMNKLNSTFREYRLLGIDKNYSDLVFNMNKLS